MPILLSAPRDVDLKPLADELGRYDLESFKLTLGPSAETARLPAVEYAFLVYTEQGMVALGERISELRELVAGAARLVVCAPRPPRTSVLRQCGADEIITPRSWVGGAVAERIIGVLIQAGEVQPARLGGLRGGTLRMRKVYREIEIQAPLSETVLVLGETGTGKELVSHELHVRSGRSGDCLALNCAALTPDLLESELFGHEKGAFSGAISSRKGLILGAEEGTLFLDEVGELSLSSQAKLLRMLEDRRVRPVGSNRWVPFKARLVLATNRDLEQACSEGSFRRDLYERIRGFRVQLPPLRERRADIPLLAHHFVAEYDKEYDGEHKIPSTALDLLFRQEWTGNVRQLRQVLWEASAFADESKGPINTARLQEALQLRHPSSSRHKIPFDPNLDSWRDVHDRAREAYLRSVLEETGGNRKAAAKRAGISRARFYEILKKMENS